MNNPLKNAAPIFFCKDEVVFVWDRVIDIYWLHWFINVFRNFLWLLLGGWSNLKMGYVIIIEKNIEWRECINVILLKEL